MLIFFICQLGGDGVFCEGLMVGEKMETESLDHISKGLGKEYLAREMACELKGGEWAKG